MKTVKSLLLGTAAGFVAFTGAQAADLPLAEPVEYVKVCDTYGKGYFYIPGTDTCLKLGGYVRFDQRIDFGDDLADDDDFAGGPFSDGYSSRARASLRFDARTETEWGTLRSYVEVHSEAGFRGESDTYLENGFIQFAGITAGRTSSFYDFVVTETYADFFSDQQVNTFAYTASFGSGFAATIGIEDRVQDRDFTPAAAIVGLDDGTSSDLPNFIAALRVDQAWGAAQISAAFQDNEGDEVALGLNDGNDFGFAVQAGLQFNLPSLGDGSYVWVQGTYSDGAVGYGFLGNGIQTGAFADITDFDADGDNNELWAIGGGFNFAVTETVAFSASAAYIEYSSNNFLLSAVDGTDDREIIQVAGRVVWTPVDNLHIGLEAQYTNVDFSSTDPLFDDGEVDDLRLQSRIQRSW